MEKTIFTEQNIYTIIDVWYKDDEVFKIIARGLVKTHLAKGLNIDDDFLLEMMRLERNGWGCEVEA